MKVVLRMLDKTFSFPPRGIFVDGRPNFIRNTLLKSLFALIISVPSFGKSNLGPVECSTHSTLQIWDSTDVLFCNITAETRFPTKNRKPREQWEFKMGLGLNWLELNNGSIHFYCSSWNFATTSRFQSPEGFFQGVIPGVKHVKWRFTLMIFWETCL